VFLSDPEHEAIRAAVERCFATRRGQPLDGVVAGPLLDYIKLFDGLPGFLAPLQNASHVQSLRVQEIEGASAFCDCDIVTTEDYATAVWRGRGLGRITAPLVLERTREGWKVVDFALNGRRVLGTLRLYDTAVDTLGGFVTVRPRALELATAGTVLVLDLVNRGQNEVFVEQATISGKPRLGPFLPGREHAYLDGTRHVPGGSTERTVAAWAVSRATLTKSLDVDLRLAVPGAARPEPVRLSLPFSVLPGQSVAAWQLMRQPLA
jgi:hypothetical protein